MTKKQQILIILGYAILLFNKCERHNVTLQNDISKTRNPPLFPLFNLSFNHLPTSFVWRAIIKRSLSTLAIDNRRLSTARVYGAV